MTFDDDLEAARDRAGIRRFRIKRLSLDVSGDWPWQLHDRQRPYVFGHARTHGAAVLLVDAIRAGHSTVLDDDDEVIAYRPGPADPVFEQADVRPFLEQLREVVRPIAEGWGTLFGVFPPRRSDYALLPGDNIPCSVLPVLEVPPPARRVCTCWRLVRDPDAPYGVRHGAGCDLA